MENSSYELAELVSAVAREIRHRSRSLPLAPHQSRALRLIAREDIRPARLAEALQVTPRAVTEVVDTLAEQGLVRSVPDPADRRAKIVQVTEMGRGLLDRAQAARAEIAAEMFGVLSAEERLALKSLLEKVST